MSKERWENLKGYEDLYAISTDGVIYDKLYERIKKTHISFGYEKVALSDENKVQKMYSVHRLIAIQFISNSENKPHVHHIDDDKLNNAVSNLQWVTPKEHGALMSDESKRKFRETYAKNRKARKKLFNW